mgnify:CR=1 FL=1
MSDEVRPWDLLNPNVERTTKEIRQERLDICRACPHFISLTSQCRKCGCIMPLKTKLKDASCPVGKWLAVAEVEDEDYD